MKLEGVHDRLWAVWAQLNRLRGRMGGVMSVIGVALIAGGLLLFLEGKPIFAAPVALVGVAVAWLSQAWEIPGTREAYLRWLGRTLADWRLEDDRIHDASARRITQRLKNLEPLGPLRESLDDNEALTLSRELEALRRASSRGDLSSAEAMREWLEAWQILTRRAGSSVSKGSPSADSGAVVESELAEAWGDYVDADKRAVEATRRVVRMLATKRAPRAMRTQHRELADAVQHLAEARVRLSDCVAGLDVHAAMRGADEVEARRQDVERRLESIALPPAAPSLGATDVAGVD